jgi:cathepsin H
MFRFGVVSFVGALANKWQPSAPLSESEAAKLFNDWQTHFGVNGADYGTWSANLEEVVEINMGEFSWIAGLNEYSHMSWEEFKAHYNLEPQNCAATQPRKSTLPPARFPAANNKDWRTDIPIHVKDQGSCGSCWAFSTTGATEAHNYLATGKDVQLAEQQLVDCANHFDCHGCNGGLPSKAFEYLHYAGGQMKESDYKYTAKTGKSCNVVESKFAAVVASQVNITYKDEDQLVEALAQHGPVSVAYQVASDFRHYAGGVYDSTTCKSSPQDVNHAVLAVGFDTDKKSGKDYYIVKNSWGSSFGVEGGYFWMVRGKNMCGVGDCASFPVMKGETGIVA